MIKRHKELLRTLVGELRRTLAGAAERRGDLDRELERLGIAPDGTIRPLDALPGASVAERRAHHVATVALGQAGAGGAAAARAELVERAAYSWINRLLALRTMEARGLIEETLRANPDYEGLPEALYVLRATQPEQAGGPDGGWWAVIAAACAAQAAALPGLFDPTDPVVALRPSVPALLHAVAVVGGMGLAGFSRAESDAAFADPDAVGWAYQFYQEEAKARTYAKLGAGGKVQTRAEIAAATQLFTEPYMVQWLLQNSLGRSYHAAYPASALPATWQYYIGSSVVGRQSSVGGDGDGEAAATNADHGPRTTDGGYATPVTQNSELRTQNLAGLTVLDPCMGSGHFLRAAFDMLAAMYREQYPAWGAAQIAETVLRDHLHGIDIDPRAAQLAALTLYLRAQELVQTEAKAHRSAIRNPQSAIRNWQFNLATTPRAFAPGALARHLERYPDDALLRPLLVGIFAALEQADILGSLIHPGDHLDPAIAEFQRPRMPDMEWDAATRQRWQDLHDAAVRDAAAFRGGLLAQVARSFAAEAGETDVAAALLGREAGEGVRLLTLLDRRYAVVVTNPPYMGSKNMDDLLKKYVQRHYPSGKYDLYTSFIIRCLELTCEGGRIAMVTMQGWMLLSTFAELRALLGEKLSNALKNGGFTGLLRETSIELLAHLGPNAFEEITGEVVQSTMLIARKQAPISDHEIFAFRLIGLKRAEEKAHSLRKRYTEFSVQQSLLLQLVDTPVIYWWPSRIAEAFLNLPNLSTVARVYDGLTSGETERAIRFTWEVGSNNYKRWYLHEKGGRYSRWWGLNIFMLDWRPGASVIYNSIGGFVRNDALYGFPGLIYSRMASGSLGVRLSRLGHTFDTASRFILPHSSSIDEYKLISYLNTRPISYMLRLIVQSLDFTGGYVERLPILTQLPDILELTGRYCIAIKKVIAATDLLEFDYNPNHSGDFSGIASLLVAEAFNENTVATGLNLDEDARASVYAETGTPAGWFPLIAGYDALPPLPTDLDLPPLPAGVLDHLATHPRRHPDSAALAQIKATLRTLYEAGPGAKEAEPEEAEAAEGDEAEAAGSGAHIPIPTETFLEALSVRLQLHPISVYWLLEEGRAAGWRCKPEERRLLEDRLSVLVLRLLGHRWPRQIAAGEPPPAWADADGIIPLTPGPGETPLAERVRARLRAEAGDLGAQQVEALLADLTGESLDSWLRRSFFPRHVRQFKYRPVAWQLASTPGGGKGGRKGGGRRAPAFACLLYYHACAGDALPRIRTGYVEPRLRAEQARLAEARAAADSTAAALAADRVTELESFIAALRVVEDEGFAGPDLDRLLAAEPLDRWAGDGLLAPLTPAALAAAERAWQVDLNDGVRVNIAPLQLAGLLATDVLKAPDARKALADRARWRSDERRWTREGKLPRPGWQPAGVPESPQWTAHAPQRAAEAAKLAAKRAAAGVAE